MLFGFVILTLLWAEGHVVGMAVLGTLAVKNLIQVYYNHTPILVRIAWNTAPVWPKLSVVYMP